MMFESLVFERNGIVCLTRVIVSVRSTVCPTFFLIHEVDDVRHSKITSSSTNINFEFEKGFPHRQKALVQ